MKVVSNKEMGGAADSVTPARLRDAEHPVERERALFESLEPDSQGTIPWSALLDSLELAGLRMDDPRLEQSTQVLADLPKGEPLGFDDFRSVVQPNIILIERALQGQLIIPEFKAFANDIELIYLQTKGNVSGSVADYIPQLSRVDPEQFGLSLCTIDGQRHQFGESEIEFCVQSCCKPINYCLALEQAGENLVHRHVGREPSGQGFSELTLNSEGLPHNPMINAGAIMCCSLINPELSISDRFDHVVDMWAQLSGGIEKPGFSNATYLSERSTGDRNFALGYFMRENKAFPQGTDLHETLEFYFQCCAIEMTTSSMSVVAATLARGGICPVTNKRVLSPSTVKKCLSLMYSCGMYDFSGEWAFSIGLPAKSGVSGAVMIVVPNVMGFCVWSPRLDRIGNSERGIDFAKRLVSRFNFHNYDNLIGGLHDKVDPRLRREQIKTEQNVELKFAATEADVTAIQRLVAMGADVGAPDYDGRTALHVAASEGRDEVVRCLINQGVELNPADRWGSTPLDDAYRSDHQAVIELLEGAGAKRHT